MNIFKKQKNHGLVSIALAVVFVLISAVLMAISSTSTIMGMKIINNNKYKDLSFDAAEAGINYAQSDLNKNFYNYASLTSIDSTTNVSLNNNTSFSVNFKNVSSGDTTLLQVTSTGIENNTNISKTITQLFQFKKFIVNSPNAAAVAGGDVVLVNKSTINSPYTEDTIWASGYFSANGPQAYTTNVLSYPLPSSTWTATTTDVIEGDSSLSALSSDQFANNFFGESLDSLKTIAHLYYANNINTNYSSQLNGQKGKIIYIQQTNSIAELDQGITVGSPSEPVILIVDGQFKMSGFAKFYGVLYLTEKWVDKFDYGEINGTVIVDGDLKLKGSATINFDPNIIDKVVNNYGVYYKVSGSWKDF